MIDFLDGRSKVQAIVCLILILGLATVVVSAAEAFAEKQFTPAGTEIVNGLAPPTDHPDSYGQMLVKWTNSLGKAPGQATADTIAWPVGVLAVPHLLIDDPQQAEIAHRPTFDSSVVALTAWNLGNASDSLSFHLESSEDLAEEFDYQLCATPSCEQIITTSNELKSIVANVDSASFNFYLKIGSPSPAEFANDTVTVIARTGLDTGAWEQSPLGRREQVVEIIVTEQELERIVFTEEQYRGFETLGVIYAEQPEHLADSMVIELWTEDLQGNLLDDKLTIKLEIAEETGIFTGKFGFTQGRSRVDSHPQLDQEIPLLTVTGDTVVIRTRVVEEGLSGEWQALWGADPDPDYLTTIDQVRNWPNPYKPRTGEPLVFQNLPADPGMEIYIYNVQGQLVRRLTDGRGVRYFSHGNEARWWGKNDAGSDVASGIYIYVVQSRYGVTRGQITVVR